MELDDTQVKNRKQLMKSSIIGGVIVGAIAGGIAYWLLGAQTGAIRAVEALAAGGVVAAALAWKNFHFGAKEAKCEKCGAIFSVSRTDRNETLVESEQKEEREELEDGSIKTTRWTEEVYDVVDTYTCAKCGNVTTKEYNTTKRKNETSQTKAPAAKKGKK